MDFPPPFLPPRRPASLPNLSISTKFHDSSTHATQKPIITPPPFLPPRTPSVSSRRSALSAQLKLPGLPEQLHLRTGGLSAEQSLSELLSHSVIERSNSDRPRGKLSKPRGQVHEAQAISPRLRTIQDDAALYARPSSVTGCPQLRHSSLRIQSRPSEEDDAPLAPLPRVLSPTYPETRSRIDFARPYSHPQSKAQARAYTTDAVPTLGTLKLSNEGDAWKSSALSSPRSQDSSPISSPLLRPRPRASFARLSSLDNLMTYREERAEWKRASSILQNRLSTLPTDFEDTEPSAALPDCPRLSQVSKTASKAEDPSTGTETPSGDTKQTFRHFFIGEVGFCFTVAMTQFLAEYLISGFAIELPLLLERTGLLRIGGPSLFWPASLLSLILSAMLLVFARISDMYGGYLPFMFGVTWLTIWTLVPGFSESTMILDVSRAMQGLAIAAFTPSTFTMIGSIYPDGARKNFVLGLYSGCAPLGFYAGFLTAGALPAGKPQWYFWIAAILSAVTAVTAYLTVPHDRVKRDGLSLKMDWLGAFLITAGLILVSYALAAEPYASNIAAHRSGFSEPQVYAPLVGGIVLLLASMYVEGWYAKCPLLPFDFFKPKSVLAFCLAGLCFYASYGVWLYVSAEYIQSPSGITSSTQPISGIELALWYTPTAIGGLILCVVGGALLHVVPIYAILLLSGLAWIAAPLLLALAPLPLSYWAFVLPSMICATLGIDLTFTVSIVFISSVQPLKYQGLSGAVCSILVNLAISFALSISEIVMLTAEADAMPSESTTMSVAEAAAEADHVINKGFQAAFLYAAASAGLGFAICVLFVRISRSMVTGRQSDEERIMEVSSETTTLYEDNGNGREETAERDA